MSYAKGRLIQTLGAKNSQLFSLQGMLAPLSPEL